MKTSQSSRRWLREHHNDTYVKKARQAGYRSRAAYKLLEIQQRDKIILPGMSVVDLGAAPGGWSQVAANLVGHKGCVIALDILPMLPIENVTILHGDFMQTATLEKLLEQLSPGGVDLVISDMAPNMSGVREVDQARAILLAELALDFAQKILKPKGAFLVKVFQGPDSETFLRNVRQCFEQVIVRKPDASRGRSPEVYVLAKTYRL